MVWGTFSAAAVRGAFSCPAASASPWPARREEGPGGLGAERVGAMPPADARGGGGGAARAGARPPPEGRGEGMVGAGRDGGMVCGGREGERGLALLPPLLVGGEVPAGVAKISS